MFMRFPWLKLVFDEYWGLNLSAGRTVRKWVNDRRKTDGAKQSWIKTLSLPNSLPNMQKSLVEKHLIVCFQLFYSQIMPWVLNCQETFQIMFLILVSTLRRASLEIEADKALSMGILWSLGDFCHTTPPHNPLFSTSLECLVTLLPLSVADSPTTCQKFKTCRGARGVCVTRDACKLNSALHLNQYVPAFG